MVKSLVSRGEVCVSCQRQIDEWRNGVLSGFIHNPSIQIRITQVSDMLGAFAQAPMEAEPGIMESPGECTAILGSGGITAGVIAPVWTPIADLVVSIWAARRAIFVFGESKKRLQ